MKGGRTEPARTLREVADLVEYLPPGCALARELGGEMALPVTALLTREVEYTIRNVAWQLGGGKGQGPERIPLPESEADKRREQSEFDRKLAAYQRRQARQRGS